MLLSAAALAYEVLLMRLFSIIQWHHFASMVISLALLGYGASGTFLSLLQRRLLSDYRRNFLLNTGLFSIASLLCFLLAQRLPFNMLEMFWHPRQWLMLLLCYLLLVVPFFFAANAICLSLARFPDRIAPIYAFDLLGAGLGALGVVYALSLQPPMGVLRSIAILGLLAAAFAPPATGTRRRWQAALPYLSMGLCVALLPTSWMRLQPSEYKALSQQLNIIESVILLERSSPLGQLTLVDSKRIPLRVAPGLSLNSRQEPPPQLGLFIDGEGPAAINYFQGDPASLEYLDFLTSALPYHLRAAETVLVLGLGGGSQVLQASYHRAKTIDVVEPNPQLVQLLWDEYARYAGLDRLPPEVQVHTMETRGFMASNDFDYDLIQFSPLDSASTAGGGVQALNQGYLYTREAFSEYLRHLNPNGLLSITRWLKLPPRDAFKLMATAIQALQHEGVRQPGRQLVLIRGLSTSTLIIKNGAFNTMEIDRLRRFSQERAFDLVWYPGIDEGQTNRYNLLAEPVFYRGATALLGPNASVYTARYKFDLRPTTDDRPYFFNFFKWKILPEILAMYRQGGISLLELGYPILVLTLLQALLASLVLILLPLAFLRRQKARDPKASSLRVLLYFGAIGLAFMAIEIVYLQKFVLFLSHPIYAAAVVLAGFLVFSGLGSLYAGKLIRRARTVRLPLFIALLSALALTYLWWLPALFSDLAGAALGLKIALSLLLIAPLGFCMGVPFPLGLSWVARSGPALVPWAWGINGCASLLSAIATTLLSLHLGFDLVLLLALVVYAGAALAYPER